MSLFSKAGQSYENYKAKKAKERANEEARQKAISSGKIKPITTSYNMERGEKAYIIFNANKNGLITQAISSTHKQGAAENACCGCCLLGPLGALLGGLISPSKTHHSTVEKTGLLDSGVMVFTDRRFLFVGNKAINGLSYDRMLNINFHQTYSGSSLGVKYPEMASGEFYSLSGADAKIAETWYQGINKLMNKKG